MAGQVANLESAVEHLEDAVAIVNPRGELLFANPAMRALLPDGGARRRRSTQLLSRRPSAAAAVRADARQPAVARAGLGGFPDSAASARAADDDARDQRPDGDLVGVMLVARNLEYLSQVQSTIRYSRKLAALGRLSAGVAHEVKNPLNAMMIHLELLRQQFAARAAGRPAGGAGRAARRERPWLRKRRHRRASRRRRRSQPRRCSTST